MNWVDSRTPVLAGRRSPAGSAEQFDGDEAELAIADVLPVMDQRFVRRVLGVGRVTDVVLAGNHRHFVPSCSGTFAHGRRSNLTTRELYAFR